jgi:hypothetical protein
MNDQLRSLLRERMTHGGEVEEVKPAARQAVNPPTGRKARCGLDEAVPDQSAGTGDPGE